MGTRDTPTGLGNDLWTLIARCSTVLLCMAGLFGLGARWVPSWSDTHLNLFLSCHVCS